MWTDLYNYVEVSLRYILVFQNQNNQFLVFDDLTDTRMPGLWNGCGSVKSVSSSSRNNDDYDLINEQAEKRELNSVEGRFHNHVSDIKRNTYESYHSVIEENKNIEFEVIHIPFPISLYRRIIKLSRYNENTFDIYDICHILPHLSMFGELRKGILAFSICMHLQNNNTLLQDMINYKNNPAEHACAHHTKLLSSLLLSSNENATYFREIANSYIVFHLIDKNENTALIHGKSLKNVYFTENVNLRDFSLAFLFDSFTMNYVWLRKNQYTLREKLINPENRTPYTIFICDEELRFDDTTMIDIVTSNIALISTCMFFASKNIGEIILNFRDVCIQINFPDLSWIRAPITAICQRCSLAFVKSVPKNFKIKVSFVENLTAESFSDIPTNVVKAEFTELKFSERIVFPDHIKVVQVKQCELDENSVLIFNKKHKDVTIKNTLVRVTLPGFHTIQIGKEFYSCFKFITNKNTGQRQLILSDIKIEETVNVDPIIEEITFSSVKVFPESCVIFNRASKHLNVSRSVGSFDLGPYMGIRLYFDSDMKLEISPIYNSAHSLSQMRLFGFRFDESARLTDIYEKIVLKNISTSESAEIVLNRKCKELVIYDSNVVINAQNIEKLDSLNLQFSISRRNVIKFIGLKRLKRVCFMNICQRSDSIVALLSDCEEVNHLQFESNYNSEHSKRILAHCNKSMAFFLSKAGCETDPRMQSKFLAIKDEKPSTLIYEISDIIVNSLLEKILREQVMNTVSKLEFTCVAVDMVNCRSLGRLENLEVLQVCAKNITGKLLYNLPINLKLLNIAAPSKMYRNWTTEYMLKPSIVMHQCKSLKVMVVDVQFLCIFYSISVLMPSLKVLKIRYSELYEKHEGARTKKVKVNELMIECSNRLVCKCMNIVDGVEMSSFINFLGVCIDFNYLKYFVLVSPTRSISLDPITRKARE